MTQRLGKDLTRLSDISYPHYSN